MRGVLSAGGEFVELSAEARYRAEHLPEYTRQMRICCWCTVVVNLLFLFSDWRFHGHPHFYFAIAARATIEIASLASLALAGNIRSFRHFEMMCMAWACLVIPASAVLVSPHTDIALLVTFILPPLFYLVIPVSFRLALTLGLSCSAAALAAYLSSALRSSTTVGLIAGMVMSNVIFALVLSRENRWRRRQWAATQAERAANLQLLAGRNTLQKILKAIPTPLILSAMDNGTLIQANDAAGEYFGAELLNGSMKVENFIDRQDWSKLVLQLQSDGQAEGFETRIHFPDGSARDVLMAATTVPVADAEALLTIFVDITRRKEAEAMMERLANTDSLSGLPNRTKFFTAAALEMRRAERYRRPLAVLMIDFDFFKRINDTEGHDAGDLALRAFADLCRAWVRRLDIVARLGGEEFGVLLPETDASSALVLADRLRAAVENLRVDRLTLPITVSIGVSEVFPGEATVDAALSRADQALYSAKKLGRNRAVLYDSVEIAT